MPAPVPRLTNVNHAGVIYRGVRYELMTDHYAKQALRFHHGNTGQVELGRRIMWTVANGTQPIVVKSEIMPPGADILP